MGLRKDLESGLPASEKRSGEDWKSFCFVFLLYFIISFASFLFFSPSPAASTIPLLSRFFSSTSISSSMIVASPLARPNESIQTRRGGVVDFGRGLEREEKSRLGHVCSPPSPSSTSPPRPSQSRSFELKLVALEHCRGNKDANAMQSRSHSEPRRRRRIETLTSFLERERALSPSSSKMKCVAHALLRHNRRNRERSPPRLPNSRAFRRAPLLSLTVRREIRKGGDARI